MILPSIQNSVLAKAILVWNESIEKYGRSVTIIGAPNSGQADIPTKAFCKRPKILGQWDRTQGSFDQEKWIVMLRNDVFPDGVEPEKFMRVNWDNEDHVILNVAMPVELQGTLIGYRVLVKG